MEHGKHRSLHEGQLNAPWKNEELLKYKYYNEKKSLYELSDEFGVSESSIADWMDKHGIERREKWEHVSDMDRENGDFV